MNAVDLIIAKRDGQALDDDEIRWFIAAYTEGTVSDEQAAAMAMAVFFQGLDARELATWTQAMIDSGVRLRLADVGRPTVDKHSTGGVGDKVSLVLCPLVAACGAAVPQLSGRGLGHTGGTLDKMEAIPGWTGRLTNDEFVALLHDPGAVIAMASDQLAPADRKLYALRDVTGTVASIPLIASSIMSKKIAEGTEALVLDVKTGSGAFMTDHDRAVELAHTMVGLGERAGVRTVALVTDMDQPLGLTAGNAIEVAEAVETLQGGGPDDLREVTLALAREMVALAGLDVDPADVLASGRAHDVWRTMVAGQHGDPDAPLPTAREIEVVGAEADGVVARIDALAVGLAAWRLGAGRARKEDPVSPTAGVRLLAPAGTQVSAGSPLFELHTDDPDRLARARPALADAVTLADEPPSPRPLVLDRVTA